MSRSPASFILVLGFLIGWIANSPAWAADDAEPLTIHQAVRHALERNTSIRSQRARVGVSDQHEQLSWSALYPSVSGEIDSTYRKDSRSASGQVAFGGDPYNQYLAQLSATQPLFRWGILSSLTAASETTHLEKIRLQIQERDVTINVIDLYYQLLLASTRLSSLERAEKLDQEAVQLTEKYFRIGRGQKIDLLQAKTTLALVQPKLAQARNTVSVLGAQLATALSLPSVRPIKLTSGFVVPPRGRVDTLLQQESAPQTLEMKQAQLSATIYSLQKPLALSNDLPQLLAVGNIGRQTYRKIDLLDSDSTSWSLALKLSIPIFSGLSSHHLRQEQAAESARLEIEQEKTTEQARLQDIQSQSNLDLAYVSIETTHISLALAQSANDEARRSYKLSTIDLNKYLTIQQNLLDAEIAHEQAQYDCLMAIARIFTARQISLDKFLTLIPEGA